MKAKKSLLGMFAMVALVFANLGATINCFGLFYQPKYPQK